ncbi:MAG: hypothetical protein KME60_24735 [Cyanomargarita calcarea GSE-NOS-MK-12-04C]|uniref:DUF4145 domain-containing protein n=1 Tax=Cyanomargarita calcarea GSE-NOS-MK-12-04C TaxID=2839659 RepID=A0A951QR76_9CYAN|nr:hypothetical protein [Cyanomargarita calcarea GSE-NOS-MK-12-04C]
MSDIEKVIKISQKVEVILRDRYNAQGHGLGELYRNVENKLDADLIKQLRQINYIRNEVVHNPDYNLAKDKQRFFRLSKDVLIKLSVEKTKQPSFSKGIHFFSLISWYKILYGLIVLGLIGLLYVTVIPAYQLKRDSIPADKFKINTN